MCLQQQHTRVPSEATNPLSPVHFPIHRNPSLISPREIITWGWVLPCCARVLNTEAPRGAGALFGRQCILQATARRMWVLVQKLELFIGSLYSHRIYVFAYRSHELFTGCLCLPFSLYQERWSKVKCEHNFRKCYIDTIRVKWQDIKFAKEPGNL